MKKPNNSKKNPAKKTDKAKDSGELRKPAKLKPLKEKEKKNWKNNLDEDEDDFEMDEDGDVKFENDFDADDDEDGGFYDDDTF